MGRVLLDEKIVGTTQISAKAPPVTPPVSPPVTPPTTVGYLEEHKKINSFLKKEGYSYRCPSIAKIAESTKLDEATVKSHVDIMIVDENVTNVNKTGEIICNVDSLQRLAENLRKLRT